MILYLFVYLQMYLCFMYNFINNMKKKFAVTLLSIAVAMSASAIRAIHQLFPMVQSDGSTVMLYKNGDGRLAFYTTPDNHVVVRDSNGTLCYGELKDGELVPSNVVVHNIDNRTSEEIAFLSTNMLKPTDEALVKLLAPFRYENTVGGPHKVIYSSTADGLGKYGTCSLGSLPSIGTPIVPVIMVEFADTKFYEDMTVEKYTRFLNDEGYHEDNSYQVGSLKDYYKSQSRGMFDPTFDVCAKVTMSNGYAYYGANTSAGGDNMARLTALLREAVEGAIAQGVDFNKYVVDGRIPNVIIYYAGKGEATSNDDNTIWPHEMDLPAYNCTFSGFKFSSYFVGNERYGSEPNTIQQGMGVMVHELGHALGLPDIYVTNYAYSKDSPMGGWSVMDSGEYDNMTYAPVGMNAYERSYLGWLDIRELKDAEAVALKPASDNDGEMAVLVRNPANEKEYFIIENRQPDTWYGVQAGSGLLVSRIAYDKSAWYSNVVNNVQKYKRAMTVTANGRKMNGNDATETDLFGNGKNNITSFNLYDGSELTSAPIYKIVKQPDGVITFNFKDRTLLPDCAVVNDEVFEKVTDMGTLTAEDEIVFVNEADHVGLANKANSGVRMVSNVKIVDGKICGNEMLQKFNPVKAVSGSGWGFRLVGTTTVLGINSSGLRTATKADNSCIATVNIVDGNATVQFGGNASRKIMAYDTDNVYFTTFADAQNNMQIYRKTSSTGINAVSVGKTATDGKMYNLSGQQVGEGYKGIVIVNGKKMLKK